MEKKINRQIEPIPSQISNLTPLRGIAALMVLLFHVNEYSKLFRYEKIFPQQTFGNIINRGYLWVDLFFIVSGFIIYHVYGRTFVPGSKRDLYVKFKKFIISRFARIYPLHLIILLLLIMMEAIIFFSAGSKYAFTDTNQLSAIPAEIFLLNCFNIFDWLKWNIVSWSIGAEWYTYLLAPFIFIFLIRKRMLFVWVVSLIISLSVLIIINYVSVEGTLNVTSDLGFIRCLFGFIGGTMLYKIYENGIIRVVFSKDLFSYFSVVGIVICLSFVKFDWVVIPFFWLLLLSVASNNGGCKLLNNRFIVYMGELSYSIYILQLVPLFFFMYFKFLISGNYNLPLISDMVLWLIIIIYISVVIGLAIFTNKFIEIPIRSKIKNTCNSRF